MTRPSPDLRPDPVAREPATCAWPDSSVSEPLVRLDRALFQWHRLSLKGEMARKLLADLGIDLEPAQVRALGVLGRLRDSGGEPTVGRLAEELGLDPSRASRVASELIARGHVRREAAQEDGRKTLLVVTDGARRDLARFGELRRAKQAAIFADWPEADVEAFTRLFDRYADGVARVCRGDL